MAILVWLSPILVPILAAGVLVFVQPLLVGVAVAIGTLVAQSVYWLTPRQDGPGDEVLGSDDPWSRLVALSESPRAPGGGAQPADESPDRTVPGPEANTTR